jgi:hypothetical protein
MLFRATWQRVLAASFKTRQKVSVLPGKGWSFQGEKDLGFLGGPFRCTGTAVHGRFSARYESDLDRGSFEMRR